MFRIIALIGAFLLFVSTVNAQNLSLKGVLQDRSDKVPLQGATVRLALQSDTLVRHNAVSDKQGAFEFKSLAAQTYILTVSSVGYETFSQTIILTDSSKDLGMIQVSRQAKLLSEVTIKVSAPPVKQKTDTLEYAASAFKVNPDANAEDMMKKMPGVTVDKGTVTAQGEQVRKVTIDGREFFGDDATAALRNLPAEVIDKIQVFDRLSDQAQFTGFDDGNAVKAINIVTKADMRNGQFGRLFAGYGTDDRYSAGGNMTFFNGTRRISLVGQTNNINQQNFASQDLAGVTSNVNRGGGGGGNRGGGGGGGPRGGGGGGGNFGGGGGNFGGGQGNFLVGQQPGISKTNALGINYSDEWGKKLQVTGSYFFNKNDNLNNETINREYFSKNDSTQFYREHSLTASTNYNHRFNMRMEYKIDSSNSIIFSPRLRIQKNDALSTLESDLRDPSGLLNEYTSRNATITDGYNLSGELLYRHAFKKRGRSFSISLNSGYNRNDGDAYIESINKFFKGTTAGEDSLRQFSDIANKSLQYSANVSYTEPIGKGQLQFTYNPSWSDNKASQQTFHDDGTGKYVIFDDSLSNVLDNTYTTQNGGVSYRVGDRDNNFSVGLNYQQAVLEGDQVFPYPASVSRSFSDFLPNLRFQRKLSAKSSIRFFYRTRTNPPSVTQLQDVINIRNVLFPTSGNPALDQDYNHTLIARYQFTNSAKRTSFFANFFVQKTQDYITNATYLITKDSAVSNSITLREGARLTKPVNLDGYWSARSFFTLGLPIKLIKSNLNLNAGVSYSRIPGLIDNVENLSNSYNYNLGAVIASNINEFVDFTVSYSANFNVVRNTIQPELNNDYFSHTFGFQTNLLTKNGWVFQSDLNNQIYRGLTEGFNQDYWLWNLAVGKKFLKEQKGELKLSVFDLLKQNQSINREVTESYVQDVQNDVLRQYFMLTFTYKLRNFGNKNRSNAK